MKRPIQLLLLVVAALIAGIELFWPEDPSSWRTFARTASDSELRNFPNDLGPRRSAERWRHYLDALRTGDSEALQLAARLGSQVDGHAAEEFFAALGWNLETRPADVFALVSTWRSPQLVCMNFEHDVTPEVTSSIQRRRIAVMGLLDGGFSELAAACLNELRD